MFVLQKVTYITAMFARHTTSHLKLLMMVVCFDHSFTLRFDLFHVQIASFSCQSKVIHTIAEYKIFVKLKWSALNLANG